MQRGAPQGAAKARPIKASPNFAKNFHRQNGINAHAAVRVRSQVNSQFPGRSHWFNHDFFHNHHISQFDNSGGVNWWGDSGWGGVSNWLPWGWQDPNYYYPDYNPDSDDSGYPPASDLYLQLQQEALDQGSGVLPQELNIQDENPPAPEQEAPAPAPAAVQPGVSSDSGADTGEWLPLGVYSAGQSTNDAGYSNLFVQLAIDKSGDIAGTYYNASTDEAHPLEGLVDKDTQEAVWKVSDNPQSPIMTTGLYNLTQDVATVEVHFPNGTVQAWVLVRVKQ
jgi:hypothetical protein